MKKLLLVAVILLSSVALSHAQRPETPEAAAKQNMEWVKTFLTLNDDQTPKVEAIFLDSSKKMFAIFESGDFDIEKFQKLLAEQDTALGKVLTKEQLETYKKKFQERMEAMRGGGGF
jgi:Spy/CpxP family protein refolding chaperone